MKWRSKHWEKIALWEIVDKPKENNIVDCRWILNIILMSLLKGTKRGYLSRDILKLMV